MTPESGQDPINSSPFAEQLARGFRRLRFTPELESQFWRDQHEQGLTQLRISFLLGIVLALAFFAMHQRLLPPPDPLTLALRYGVLLPALCIGLAVTLLRGALRWIHGLAAFIAPLLVVVVALLVLRAERELGVSVFTALVLTTIFVYYLLGLSFYGALRSNLVGFAAFLAVGSRMALPEEQFFYQAMLLGITNLVGATVAYSLESARRTGWLEARLLAEMAERDGLTGIYNRRRLDTQLQQVWQQAIREQRSMALLMIDIDCFKPYNDRYGHQAGDEVLKDVARALARAARRPLDVVARYGGEEFVVVLYDTTREYAGELARQVLQGVRRLAIPHAESRCAPVVTVSVGVAYVQPVAGRSVEGFLQLADEALYAAKGAGRDRVHVMADEYTHIRTGSFDLGRRGHG